MAEKYRMLVINLLPETHDALKMRAIQEDKDLTVLIREKMGALWNWREDEIYFKERQKKERRKWKKER